MTRRGAWVAVLLMGMVLIGAPWGPDEAAAYDETGAITDCVACHPTGGESSPHGGYTSTGDSCTICHDVHRAPGGATHLLKGPTTRDTCETCHDSTGGRSVYGAIEARGLQVSGGHRLDIGVQTPFGDEVSGGPTTTAYQGVNGGLTCIDCHDPHDRDVVDPFIGDRLRTGVSTGTPAASSHLLRRQPGSSEQPVAEYGSDWCASCHRGKLLSQTAHPVETTDTPDYYSYGRAAVFVGSSETTISSLGSDNAGYLMPFPRTAEQAGHVPLCQQCHEDARSVGSTTSPVPFSVSAPDGESQLDNPRFQSFPHESIGVSLLVEEGDDLCLNCHPT